MCILFVYVNDKPKEGAYQLIIGTNRDEFFTRPTQPAHNWKNHSDCIGGVDLVPGREGGTWFGVSEKGKIGALLNVVQPCGPKKATRARGHLVRTFLTSDISAEEVLESVVPFRNEFNAFHLVLIEKKKEWTVNYFTNTTCSFETITDGLFVLGNSLMDKPWRKVVHGREIFREIIQRFNDTSKEGDLVTNILAMLNDGTTYMPDPHLESATFMSGPAVVQQSSVFVDSPQIKCGTRTNTVVLIDDQGNGEFIERTMKEPIEVNNIEWEVNKIPFLLQNNTE